jgi:DNA anti-recombination protein RmuC
VERYHFYSGLQQTFQKMQHLVEEIQEERPLFRKLYEGQRMGQEQLQGMAESLTTLCEAPPLLANLAGELRTILEKSGDRQVSLQRETSETLRREIRMLTKALAHDWERRLDPSSAAP